MKRRNQRGFTPSPLIRTMFGSFANITLQRQYHKPAPIDSVYPPPPPYPPGPPCPCNVFRIVDAAYTALAQETKQVWRDALKKPGISGYNLWMKENMVAAMNHGKLCANPSASGGFSCIALELQEDPPDWENAIGLMPPIEPPIEPPPPPPDPGRACNACPDETPSLYYMNIKNIDDEWHWEDYAHVAVQHSRRNCWWTWPPEPLPPRMARMVLTPFPPRDQTHASFECTYYWGGLGRSVTYGTPLLPLPPFICYDSFVLPYVTHGGPGSDPSDSFMLVSINQADVE